MPSRDVLHVLPEVQRHGPMPQSLPPWHAQRAVPKTRHGGPRVAAEQQGTGYCARRAWPRSKRSSQETKSSSQETKSSRLLPEVWKGRSRPKTRRSRRTRRRTRQTSSYLTLNQHLHATHRCASCLEASMNEYMLLIIEEHLYNVFCGIINHTGCV